MGTEETADLIAAVNRLTSTVSNKMKDIDLSLAQAERDFQRFTTVDFPIKVQKAREINIYIDPENGDDNNIGTSSSAAFKSIKPIRVKTGDARYERINLYFRCGFEYLLDTGIARAKDKISITGWDDRNGALTLKQGFDGNGRPVSPFIAEYLYFNETGNFNQNMIIKTAEFPVGHVWSDKGVSGADEQGLWGAFIRNPSKTKLDGCHLELYDSPFCSYYLSGSAGDYASLSFILSGGTRIYKKPASQGSVKYSHMPYFLHVFGNSNLPVDFSSSGFVIAEGANSLGELFNNLSHTNVRSTHPLT